MPNKTRPDLTTSELKDLFLAVLATQFGNVSEACRLAGISRRTYYVWQAKDTAFQENCLMVNEDMLDFVESRMMLAIANLDAQLIKFVLTTKAKHRGYGVVKEGEKSPIAIQINNQITQQDAPPQPKTLAEWEVQVKDARQKRLAAPQAIDAVIINETPDPTEEELEIARENDEHEELNKDDNQADKDVQKDDRTTIVPLAPTTDEVTDDE